MLTCDGCGQEFSANEINDDEESAYSFCDECYDRYWEHEGPLHYTTRH